MTRPTAATVTVLVLAALAGAAPPPESSAPDLARRFADDVAVLASDEMEGRGLGTAGLGRAADWIEKRLRDIGLRPAFGDSYRQPFDVKTGVALEEGNALEGVAGEAWVPLGMSSSGMRHTNRSLPIPDLRLFSSRGDPQVRLSP